MLIGTRSIDKSEHLSQLLSQRGTPHQVLNANEVAKEAQIVALAGQSGKVTVATNMAGRGTDIKLGEGVPEVGGLHVIVTEMHDAARIDRQLCGRCGRQGDPGTFRYFLSLEDEILESGLGPKKAEKFKDFGAKTSGQVDRLAKAFRKRSGKSSGATSAIETCCCTTKSSARRCRRKWARIRTWTRPTRRSRSPS